MAFLTRFIVLLLAFQGIEAAAANWKLLTSSLKGTDIYVDVDSRRELPPVQIKRPFAVRQIWAKFDYTNDKTVNASSRIQLLRFNCVAETSALVSTVSYRADGTVIYSKSWEDYDFNYEPEVPDTVGYDIMEFACGI